MSQWVANHTVVAERVQLLIGPGPNAQPVPSADEIQDDIDAC
jgi:hypothetical protein